MWFLCSTGMALPIDIVEISCLSPRPPSSTEFIQLRKDCCCSVAKFLRFFVTPMHCSTSGFPVLHHLQEFAQTHVHWVSDNIQPSPPLLSPSPPAFNLSQNQGLFQRVSFLHQLAKVLELQHPVNIQDWFPLALTPCCPRDSQESSPAPEFGSINSSVFSLFYGSTLTFIHDYRKKP